MITVYQFGPRWGLLDPSPFCTKLIAWLKLAGIPFQLEAGMRHMRTAPKGKMPYVRFEDGELMGDSSLIIARLKETHGDPLDTNLDARQQAISHAVGKMLDENFYWCIVHSRWIDKQNFTVFTRPAFFGPLGWKGRLVAPLVVAKIRRSLYAQGMGRHSVEEIAQIGCRDLRCLVQLLGDGPYLLGDRPHDIDAYAYAFVSGILAPPHASPIKAYAETTPLVDYWQRLDAEIRQG